MWVKIPNFENYEINDKGQIKSLTRTIIRNNGRPQTIKERILKHSLDDWGYPQVRLNNRTFKIHRLLGICFLGERPINNVIRHLDGNKENNSISNLKYGTESQNQLDAYSYQGYIRKHQKLTPKEVLKIRSSLEKGDRNVDLAKEFGVSQQTICDIKHNRIYNWMGDNYE